MRALLLSTQIIKKYNSFRYIQQQATDYKKKIYSH